MKNKKKLLIFIVVIALLAFITLFFVYYYKESSLLTSSDKKWLSENNKKIVDIDVLNDVSVYAMNGTGVIFDFLDYVSDETGLQFNKVPYSKEETPTGKNYKVEILDGSTPLDNNQLFIFEDSYVAISTKPIKINQITDFSGYKLGVLTSDESNVSYYLKSVKDITYHPQANIEALFKTLNDGNIDMLIVPNMLSLENTINNEDYSLNYFFTDMTKKIVLTLDSSNKSLNNILKKYFINWQNEYYVSDYNKLLLNYYLSERKINDKTKADLLSKTYVYGYVENTPYETTRKNKIVGVAAEYINRLIRLTDIDFSYKKYNTVDELNQAIKNGDVDIYFNYINSEDSKYLKTISPFIENYVVLAKTSDDYVISSFEGLKGKNIYMLGNYQSLYKYINSLAKVNTKTYDNIKKMVKESKRDKTLIIVDKELYTYYKNSEFKDYEVIYTDIMSNDYTFNVKSSNSSFYSLFNYVINTNSYYKYRNAGFNSLNASIIEKTSFEELYLLILAIILVPIILIILIIIFLKSCHKLKLVTKEDRTKYNDMLTSLKNRNYLNLQIDSWNLSKVYPQTIVIVDINNLKYINDNYGREKGDNLIVRVASILVNTQLENTEIVRTDGTEFLIYLVGYSENQIDIYLKKLRKELTELPYGFGASVGYSMIFDNIKTIDDAINEAMIDMQSDKSEF